MPTKWKEDGFYVSPYNYEKEARAGLKFPERVAIHDVTLRDGEQQCGIVLRKDEKLKIASALDEARVDRIEAGMPSVSKEDEKAIREIAHLGLRAKIFAFARCMKVDVDKALDVDVDGVVMEIPSSDHLIKYGYGWAENKAVDTAVEATAYAHKHGLYVTFFTIDSTRADFDVFWRLVRSVADRGHMDSLSVADTFGVMNPQAYARFISRIRKVTKKPLEIHAHNDFGLAVANTIAGLASGASVAHVTVNGIGERSGNTSLEELVVSLRMLYGVKTNVDFRKLTGLSRLVAGLTGVGVPPQKPIVGETLFQTESGIIAGWWSRLEKQNKPLEMLPFLPEVTGQPKMRIVLGKKSGKDSIVYKAHELGLAVDEKNIDGILTAIKEESIQRKRALNDQEFSSVLDRFSKSPVN